MCHTIGRLCFGRSEVFFADADIAQRLGLWGLPPIDGAWDCLHEPGNTHQAQRLLWLRVLASERRYAGADSDTRTQAHRSACRYRP